MTKRYYQITRYEDGKILGSYTQQEQEFKNVVEEITIEENNIGDKWEIEIIEMEEDEFENLPDFMGY